MNNAFFHHGGFGHGWRGGHWRGVFGWPHRRFGHHRHTGCLGCCGPLFFLMLLVGVLPVALAVLR